MKPVAVYAVGVLLVAVAGFCSPWWWLGFLALGAGTIWAAYDLVDIEDGENADTPGPPPRR